MHFKPSVHKYTTTNIRRSTYNIWGLLHGIAGFILENHSHLLKNMSKIKILCDNNVYEAISTDSNESRLKVINEMVLAAEDQVKEKADSVFISDMASTLW